MTIILKILCPLKYLPELDVQKVFDNAGKMYLGTRHVNFHLIQLHELLGLP